MTSQVNLEGFRYQAGLKRSRCAQQSNVQRKKRYRKKGVLGIIVCNTFTYQNM